MPISLPSLAGVALMAIVGPTGCSASDDGPGSPPLALRLDAPEEARSGEAVRFRLTVRNARRRTVDQPLGGKPPFDFIVSRSDGAALWRWSKGQVVQDVLELKTLRPAQEFAFGGGGNHRDDAATPLA